MRAYENEEASLFLVGCDCHALYECDNWRFDPVDFGRRVHPTQVARRDNVEHVLRGGIRLSDVPYSTLTLVYLFRVYRGSLELVM